MYFKNNANFLAYVCMRQTERKQRNILVKLNCKNQEIQVKTFKDTLKYALNFSFKKM